MIQKSTLDFLKKLKKNNHKEWFDENRATYQKAREDYIEVVSSLIKGISAFDNSVGQLEAKQCIFRINRDIRFSKDKTPYKTNFGASMNPNGRKSDSPGYYFHLEPGNSFLVGGSYMPQPPNLAAYRQEIDYNLDEFVNILKAKDFKRYFGTLHEVEKLKTVPKGYDKTNPALEYLKHKSFVVVHELKDEQLLKQSFLKNSINVYNGMFPFISFLRRALD